MPPWASRTAHQKSARAMRAQHLVRRSRVVDNFIAAIWPARLPSPEKYQELSREAAPFRNTSTGNQASTLTGKHLIGKLADPQQLVYPPPNRSGAMSTPCTSYPSCLSAPANTGGTEPTSRSLSSARHNVERDQGRRLAALHVLKHIYQTRYPESETRVRSAALSQQSVASFSCLCCSTE
jgi:hypothetical protein